MLTATDDGFCFAYCCDLSISNETMLEEEVKVLVLLCLEVFKMLPGTSVLFCAVTSFLSRISSCEQQAISVFD